MTIASYITCIRIAFIFPVMFFTSLGNMEANFYALLFFLLAGLTDYIDGYVARRTNTESNLGALLDLLADKLLVCVTLLWLATINNTFVFMIPLILIISRELAISSIRQFIVESEGVNNIKVSFIAKSKTTIQFIAISLLIISPGLGIYFYALSLSLLWIASLISLMSLFTYLSQWNKFFK